MKATLNSHIIDLSEINLDDFGWDSPTTRGCLSLLIYLDDVDLLSIGEFIWKYAQECIMDEPNFFDGEYRHDIPLPPSVLVFIENPGQIAVYLDNPFWSRETVIAILDSIPNTSNKLPVRYLIQDFRQLLTDRPIVEVEFGAIQLPE